MHCILKSCIKGVGQNYVSADGLPCTRLSPQSALHALLLWVPLWHIHVLGRSLGRISAVALRP